MTTGHPQFTIPSVGITNKILKNEYLLYICLETHHSSTKIKKLISYDIIDIKQMRTKTNS